MLTKTLLRTKPQHLPLPTTPPLLHIQKTQHHQTRSKSTSPYGRTHVWKRRLPTLPNPIVPKFPQTVIRSDGTSFVHWTTSPKSQIRLTRDTTNNPVWNRALLVGDRSGGGGGLGGEDDVGGRMGRFGRRFGGFTSATSATSTATATATVTDAAAAVPGAPAEEGAEAREESEGRIEQLSMSRGMGGALDDVLWFEQMAELTGGEAGGSGGGKVNKKKEEKPKKK